MKAVGYHRAGDPVEVLDVVDVDAPPASGPGQVKVRVTTFPVHPGDLQAVAAARPTPQSAGHRRCGGHRRGARGRPRRRPETGTRVTVFLVDGAWRQEITVDAELAVPVTDSLPDEIAAQMLVNPVTVLMLRRAAQQHFSVGFDGVVLNNAAASAVGRLFHRSQRAVRRGTETLTKSSSIPYRSTVALSLRGANSRQRLGPARKPRNCSFNDAHASAAGVASRG